MPDPAPTLSTRESFQPEVRRAMAEEIAAAGGYEVFFFGTVLDGIVTAAEVVARGHSTAVPVFLERAEEHHHVLLHNHPGGDLTPSNADLSIASVAGERGLGFFIVDNAVDHVYRVVEPHQAKEQVPLELEEIAEIFGPDGRLAQSIPQFEDRPGQRDLAVSVAQSFNDNGVVAFEAGTGVGKSYAYLVPAVLWAVANQSRVIVSTQTIALSEQLFTKDLPVLERVLGVEFRFALIKGRGNYACRRKTGEVVHQKEMFSDDAERSNWIEEIIDTLETSETGSLSDLERVPPDEVWDDFRSTTDQSLKTRCPHYQSCFYYNARRDASRAQVLIVNHHLFFADLAVRMTTEAFGDDLVIPAYDRVIFDEAHRLEEVASQHLGGGFSRIGFFQMLGRLATPNGRRGRFRYVSSMLHEKARGEAAEFLDMTLLGRIHDLRSSVSEAFETIEHRLDPDRPQDRDSSRPQRMVRIGTQRDEVSLDRLEEPLLLLRDELTDLQRTIRHGWNLLLDEPFEPESKFEGCVAEYRSAFSIVGGAIREVESILAARRGFLSWVELRGGRRGNVMFRSAPIRVSSILAESLYARISTAVMTSATLSVAGSWEFLADRLGWNLTESGRFRGEEFETPFDFRSQAILGVPNDFPGPQDPRFPGRFAELVRESVRITGGKTFVLFTSHQLLRQIAGMLSGQLESWGFPCLVQGTMPQSELLRRFRDSGRAVLFGNQTFWEGVDVPGQALSSVIIARLPFRVPSHPLERARAEELEGRGQNPFAKLTVPQAVLALKQGFGRLIRTGTDRGAVLIADSRIVTKPYGRRFLDSLPDCARVIRPWPEVRAELESFFEGYGER
ncbi:MAG: helicase C-terminal domain-containing protein [Planctomycetota bacterium]